MAGKDARPDEGEPAGLPREAKTQQAPVAHALRERHAFRGRESTWARCPAEGNILTMGNERFRDLSDLAKLLPPGEAPLAPQASKGHDGKGKSVRVTIDRKGRKGKTVTLVTGLQHNPQTLEEIARALKQFCGSGGTVKEGVIEIQGDQRERVAEKLRAMNYAVR